MSNLKISQLTAGSAQNADLIPVARAGANFAVPASSIGALATPPPLLETNSISNSVQSLLNLIAGNNISLSSNSSGGVTITNTASGVPSFTTGGAGWLVPALLCPFQLGILTIGAAAAIASGSAQVNSVTCVQFILPYNITISKISQYVITGAGLGFATTAIYSADGNTKLIDAGANAWDTHSASQVLRSVTLGTSVNIGPGIFWWATGSTDGNGSLLGYGPISQYAPGGVNAHVGRIGYAANGLSSGAMPSTLGAITGFGTSGNISLPHTMFEV